MDWSSRNINDRRADLERLGLDIDLLMRVVRENHSASAVAATTEDVAELRSMHGEIRGILDDLGWVRPDEWLSTANLVERMLMDLREKISRATRWLAFA